MKYVESGNTSQRRYAYTSIENIHKVIDPLFLDDLKAELANIKAIGAKKTRENKLKEFQDKLASLTFFDPACGSGNFLTETFLSLRHLENDALKQLQGNAIVMGDLYNPIRFLSANFTVSRSTILRLQLPNCIMDRRSADDEGNRRHYPYAP